MKLISNKTNRAGKSAGLAWLLAGLLFGSSGGVLTQERRPPNGTEVKPFLRITPMSQGNCSPLNFRVTNTGGSDSGEFSISIYRGSREHMSADTRVDTLSVENIEAKESRAFEWSRYLNGIYTVAILKRGLIAKPADRTIEIETHCVK